jgi:hypothetical protein
MGRADLELLQHFGQKSHEVERNVEVMDDD